MVPMIQANSSATIFLEESVVLSGHCVEENTVYDSTIQLCTKQYRIRSKNSSPTVCPFFRHLMSLEYE